MSSSSSQAPSEETAVSRRRPCTNEFRRDAVRLITDEGCSIAAARACGVYEQTVRNLHGKLASEPDPAGHDASVQEFKAEIKRLRKELNKAEMARAILKKTPAYFAKESL
jgi:transposase